MTFIDLKVAKMTVCKFWCLDLGRLYCFLFYYLRTLRPPACEEASLGQWRRIGHWEDQWHVPRRLLAPLPNMWGRWSWTFQVWVSCHMTSPATAAETLPTWSSGLCIYGWFAKQIDNKKYLWNIVSTKFTILGFRFSDHIWFLLICL